MKPSIGKKTQEYLSSLDSKDQNQPDYYYGHMDALDKLIYQDKLSIKQVLRGFLEHELAYVDKPFVF